MNQPHQLAQAGIRHRERLLNLASLRRASFPSDSPEEPSLAVNLDGPTHLQADEAGAPEEAA